MNTGRINIYVKINSYVAAVSFIPAVSNLGLDLDFFSETRLRKKLTPSEKTCFLNLVTIKA